MVLNLAVDVEGQCRDHCYLIENSYNICLNIAIIKNNKRDNTSDLRYPMSCR